MQTTIRRNWLDHVNRVMRSRHYGWLAESRDGDPVDEVMRDVMADVMHICRREGIDCRRLMDAAARQCDLEEGRKRECT